MLMINGVKTAAKKFKTIKESNIINEKTTVSSLLNIFLNILLICSIIIPYYIEDCLKIYIYD